MALTRITAPSPRLAATSTWCVAARHRSYATEAHRTHPSKQRLVVLGTGWGGYAFLKALSPATLRRFDVQVVSPTTSFSFTPLLAQASCATLDFRSAVEPIHSNRWMEYHHAWCDAVDFKAQRIELTSAFNPQFRLSDPLLPATAATAATAAEEHRARATYSLHYDYLVMSVGSYNATFGTKGVKENALFLKDVGDARAIRWRILGLFETANIKHHRFARQNETLTDEQEQELRRLLSFVVVGGGPTGSEFAAELHDLIKDDLARLYPNLRSYPSIRLLDAGKSILSSFDAGLADYAMKKFARDGIDVQLSAKIQRVERDAVVLEGEQRIGAGMVVWSTGITTSPLIEAFRGVAKEERTRKVLTSDTLNVLAHRGAEQLGGSVLNASASDSTLESDELVPLPNVFALGDCSSQHSTPLPATAQVASQKGAYLAQLFNAHLSSSNATGSALLAALDTAPTFKFKDSGSMASIGSGKALIDSPVKKESGALAWVLWRSAYTIMSMSWRNRFLVPANWASNLLFGRDVGRF